MPAFTPLRVLPAPLAVCAQCTYSYLMQMTVRKTQTKAMSNWLKNLELLHDPIFGVPGSVARAGSTPTTAPPPHPPPPPCPPSQPSQPRRSSTSFSFRQRLSTDSRITMAEPDSPHPPHQQQRGTILGSFLRARPRGISTSASSPPPPEHGAPPMPASPTPHSPIGDGNRRPSQPPATAPAGATSGSFSQMLRRRRSGGNLVTTAANGNGQVQNAGSFPLPAPSTSLPAPSALRASPGPAATGTAEAGAAPAHRLRLVPHIDSRRSLRFDAITRNVREGDQPLRIGRFTDRSGMGVSAANALGSNKLAFKSKVVSRAHAEIWCEGGGKFFIKDTKSSSGTFLNHVRLSAAAADSRPFELRDGDTLQLGVDYQGGNEDIYKCVRMRVEIGREWQMGANAFKYVFTLSSFLVCNILIHCCSTAAFKQLRAFSQPVKSGNDAGAGKKVAHAKSGFPDCCICASSSHYPFPFSCPYALRASIPVQACVSAPLLTRIILTLSFLLMIYSREPDTDLL